jgi:hypothetical protein
MGEFDECTQRARVWKGSQWESRPRQVAPPARGCARP